MSERLEKMVEQLITLVSKTQQDIHELKEDIKTIKQNTTETVGDIGYLQHKVGEHDATLYKLKQKLID